MEENKNLFRWMQIAAVVLTIGGAILLLFMAPASSWGKKTGILLSILLPELLSIVMIGYGIRHPEINRQYTLRKDSEGWLRIKRRIYAPDPHGKRYRHYGIAVLMIAVIFVVADISIVWEVKLAWMLPIIGLLLVAIIVLINRCERQLEQDS